MKLRDFAKLIEKIADKGYGIEPERWDGPQAEEPMKLLGLPGYIADSQGNPLLVTIHRELAVTYESYENNPLLPYIIEEQSVEIILTLQADNKTITIPSEDLPLYWSDPDSSDRWAEIWDRTIYEHNLRVEPLKKEGPEPKWGDEEIPEFKVLPDITLYHHGCPGDPWYCWAAQHPEVWRTYRLMPNGYLEPITDKQVVIDFTEIGNFDAGIDPLLEFDGDFDFRPGRYKARIGEIEILKLNLQLGP